MELEEAIKILNADILFKIQRDTSLSIRVAIETVLQELENYKTHDEKYINGEIFSAKQMKFIEKEYIPKKKIEDIKKEIHVEALKIHSILITQKKKEYDYNLYNYYCELVHREKFLKELLEGK